MKIRAVIRVGNHNPEKHLRHDRPWNKICTIKLYNKGLYVQRKNKTNQIHTSKVKSLWQTVSQYTLSGWDQSSLFLEIQMKWLHYIAIFDISFLAMLLTFDVNPNHLNRPDCMLSCPLLGVSVIYTRVPSHLRGFERFFLWSS